MYDESQVLSEKQREAVMRKLEELKYSPQAKEELEVETMLQ